MVSETKTRESSETQSTDGMNDWDEFVQEMPEEAIEETRSELGPRFANEQQRQFFDSTAPELLYSGAFGAGKSRILCEKAYHLGLRYPGVPIGIFRKVRASLAATTARTFFRDVVPLGSVVRKNVTEGWYELANGARFWLLGLDADPTTGVPSKVGSLDLALAFVDEAVELDEADWMMLSGRLRWPDVPFTQIAGATNPADPKHWLIRRFREGGDRVLLQASTTDNRFLPANYLERIAGFTGIYRERYVKGEWIAISGGLFDPAWIKAGVPPKHYANGTLQDNLQRVVVAVDPAVTAEKGSDETGIVVAGTDPSGQGYVLADLSGRMAPHIWAERVVSAYHEFKADRIVAEVNNGGDLVERTIRSVDSNVAYHSVTASRGKITRAEPVANLYGMGKVNHVADFPELVSQMIGYDGKGSSPDRLDALVWALSDLMLTGYHGNTEQSWIA
jgi:phage terminase large subunit-like protein